MQENINKRIEQGRAVFDERVYAIPYAGNKYVELANDLASYIKSQTLKEVEEKIRARLVDCGHDSEGHCFEEECHSGVINEEIGYILQALKVD